MIKSTNNIGILQDIYETKFFIIMPTYNVGYDLIKKCLLSIYCQKITCNIFLIIINDKSLKWNEEIKAIEEYKEKLNIYILENEKNIGLGPTRNIGLNYIKNNIKFSDNDYILYIDPDDFFKKNSLKKLLKKIKKGKYPDIIRFSYVSLKQNKAVINYYPVIFSSQNKTDRMWNGFFETSWLCAYSIKFIFENNLFFADSRKIHEDVYYSLVTSSLAKSITSTNIHVYMYRWNREGSITNVYNCSNLLTEHKLKWIKAVTFYVDCAYNFLKNKVDKKMLRFYFFKFNWILESSKLDNLDIKLYTREANLIEKIFNELECDYFDRNRKHIFFKDIENYTNFSNSKLIRKFIILKSIIFSFLSKKYLSN